eukprot:4604612-Prymnesium_polylepis.1
MVPDHDHHTTLTKHRFPGVPHLGARAMGVKAETAAPPNCYALCSAWGGWQPGGKRGTCPLACGRAAWAAWQVCPPWFFSVVLQ